MSEFQYIGETVENLVCVPIDEYVVGVHIMSTPEILPYVEAADPPEFPKCRGRHIIRTAESVVVVDVRARVRVFPRQFELSEVRRLAYEEAEEAGLTEAVVGSKEDFEIEMEQITLRILQHLGRLGVTVKE